MLNFTVSEFVEACNQTLDYAYYDTVITGEVSSFKVNQGKWVFFDLKDDKSSIGCFLPVFQLRIPLEDGMKVMIKGTPKLTNFGKFSFTVKQIMPVGEGTIKKSFELLKKKLALEGLFDQSRKRPLPDNLETIGVISSTGAAGYADFIKIINERWGGLRLRVAHTSVQGLSAADQIIRAINYMNEKQDVQIIAIIRGGGSADDLAVFNDEKLARTIAASKIPIITGIGHEVDESLADLAADLRGSTPSNVAQILTKDKAAEIRSQNFKIESLKNHILRTIELQKNQIKSLITNSKLKLLDLISSDIKNLHHLQKNLERLNPELILKQGYAILSGEIFIDQDISITTADQIIQARITSLTTRSKNA